MVGVSELLATQDGVVSRRQLEAAGVEKHELDRMLRRRELVRVHTGVYVDHTGPLTWRQRAWAAVLAAWPAALVLGSALEPPWDGPIHVAIDAGRRIADPDGVRVHRMRGLAPRVLWHVGPPRLRFEDNTWELVGRATDELAVIELVTGAVASRRTTPERLRAALGARPRLRHRRMALRLLDDAAAGTCSVLEHGYLTRVERAHGLPRGHRQRRRQGARGSEYRDVEYTAYGLEVELDGRVGHTGWAAQSRDADRDLDDHADGREAVRLRWRQVFGTPCRTANRIGRILRRRGWDGSLVACGPGCTAV
ncbi:type IV toxin-antitoxin system AbiEi family antitoxin domain-containing protein [Nocardioides sp. LS1]|uniref:type IV toxin-antitoxin system AbiEi family antitoxin domain-containing protein n=1 Tax=Nocardioides sp. LS1 TaxID=1027620 RepID=UPI000F617805|nr:type IV toxin-antitoxin system AbiEi family antitoxin domain-containing protein [Nocardioides sp. LS1]GCD90631.1 hypothetical protein NLS1_26370 [Nocardioides sp. LS1]